MRRNFLSGSTRDWTRIRYGEVELVVLAEKNYGLLSDVLMHLGKSASNLHEIKTLLENV